MLSKRFMFVLSLLVVASMVLAACGGTTTATDAPEVPATDVAPTAEPTPPPVTRTGTWVDEVVFTEQSDESAAIAQLQAGDIDVYADGVADAELFKTVKADSNLTYSNSYGLNFELFFNPAQNFADGRLNPFGNKKIREAMNMAVDRDYIVQELFGGLGAAKYSTLVGAFPDYARYIDVARAMEAKYAYNLEKAGTIISAEMEAMGATKNADGKWEFNGAPVVLIFIIRVEWGTPFGDYTANQLESLGFTVDRQYKTRAEASPIWNRTDPVEGAWNIYTGGWINTVISRDDGTNFGYYYTDFGGCCRASDMYTAEYVGQEFYDVALKLWNNEFTSMDERGELFKKALTGSLENSNRVNLIDTQSFFPQRANITVAADLAGGVSGSRLWPFTLRIGDQEGGTVKIADGGHLTDPWNPIGGSNFIGDAMMTRATSDVASMPDPYTGLAWPQRAESLTITAMEGLPITKTLEWVNLNFQAGEIAVPADAWADWDATSQTFIPAGEGKTAKVKVTWAYPADMFEKVTWHDGSALSVSDFVMGMIMTFDPGKAESAIYDETYVPSLEAFMGAFKGVVIESTNPLVISSYTDAYSLDAEVFGFSWWPNYNYGPGAWHNLTPAIRAEGNKEIAFTIDQATTLSVEWTNMIAGPTLENQKKWLDQSQTENFIPYAPTMGAYVTADEATTRYTNLQAWYGAKGHLWIGTGPMYVDQVFPVEKVLVLKRFEAFPDLSNKWDRFGKPHIATVDLSGAGTVTIGQEASFDVSVSFDGEAYASADLSVVKFLLFDSAGNLVATGDAEFVSEGQYKVTLGADVTAKLAEGSNKLEVAVVSKVVSVPSFAALEFVTVK